METHARGTGALGREAAVLKSSLLILSILIAFLFQAIARPVTTVAAGSSCVTSGPSSGNYTVTVCFSSPADGSTLSGNTSVAATASVSGTSPGIQRYIFYLDGSYLLTDFQSPYTFTLTTPKWVDGSHTLAVGVLMRDGFTSAKASLSVSFSNGVTSPPVNRQTFTPAPGSAPASGSPFVLVAAGDGASGETNAANVTNLIATLNPNLFLYLGDVYEKGSPAEFYNWYGNSNQAYSQFRSITNPTIGNHEYSASNKAAGYFDYWNNVPNYYSYNAGGWHLISLNSTSQFNQYSASSAQYQWLAQDLAANSAACTLVYFHHPVFSVGPQGNTTAMNPIWALLAQNKVTVVLTGHDHDYQRWVPLDGSGQPSASGVTEFVVGTGGHGIQAFTSTDSRLAAGYASTSNSFGALRLKLSSASASFAFINVQGTTLDSGSISCKNTASGSTPTPTPQPTSAPTATATPPAQPSPTNTPAPSTATPTPTPTATLAPSPTPGGSSLTFTPAADAYVNSGSPTTNYGSSIYLRADASPDLHSYLKFDVQGLSGPVKQATLRIYANSTSTVGINVSGVSDTTWDEKTITYNTAPPVSATVTGSSGPIAAAGTWLSIDVTPLVTGNGLVSLAITTSSGTAISMASREAGANSPQLIVQN